MQPPVRFFFKSSGISTSRIEQIIRKWGPRTLIGVDPGNLDYPEEDAQVMVDAIKKFGGMLHVYLVGPGMMSWSKEEQDQIKYLAKSVGIDVSKKKWHDEWFADGWQKKVQQQFEFYHKMGAYSCEIDNIDGPLEQDPEKTVEFFKNLSRWRKNNNIVPKLMMKNLDSDQLHAIEEAMKKGEITADFFCEFGLFEKGTGDANEQMQICKRLGIRAVTPKNGLLDTYNYGVIPAGIPALNIK